MANLLATQESRDDLSVAASVLLESHSRSYEKVSSQTIADQFMGDPKGGKVVNVRIRNVPVAQNLIDVPNLAKSDIIQNTVPMVINGHPSIFHELEALEWSFELKDMMTEVFEPAMIAISEFNNGFVMQQFRKVPFWTGDHTGDLTFANTSEAQISLENRFIPASNRTAILSPKDYITFKDTDRIGDFDKGGGAARSGDIRLDNFSYSMDQAVSNNQSQFDNRHFSGTFGTSVIQGAVSSGATLMTLDGATGADPAHTDTTTGTMVVGDLFKITLSDGSIFRGVVLPPDPLLPDDQTPSTAIGGVITDVRFDPPAPALGFDNDAVIFVTGNHIKNVFFEPGAVLATSLPPASNPTQDGGTFTDSKNQFPITWQIHQKDTTNGLSTGITFESFIATREVRVNFCTIVVTRLG